ncbi:P-loop containing nucleoside triphosphate hydrolase protein [Nemania sp. FL0916]|nr:P-loop containing nucleoside triphosphate hydrolase protein [Nemania sp. FL0916]
MKILPSTHASLALIPIMPNRNETIASMILSDEEKRYFRALLAWCPSDEEGLLKRRTTPDEPVAGRFRVLILGAEGCGKTAILTRFSEGRFIGENQLPSPAREQGCRRMIEIKGQYYIVDALELGPDELTEGRHLQNAVTVTDAAVLVYDVRSRDSFAQIQELHRQIRETLVLEKRQHYGIVLVGNKADSDEEDLRVVTEAEGYELACRLGPGQSRCAFRETSARTGENVDGLFILLGSELLRLQQRGQERAEALARARAKKGDGTDKSPKKGAKWRFWTRGRRHASGDATRKMIAA